MGVVVVVVVLVALAGFVLVSLFVRRYRERDVPERSWRATDEVFRDPSTDRVLRVWLDAAGGRHYVPDGAPPPPGTP